MTFLSSSSSSFPIAHVSLPFWFLKRCVIFVCFQCLFCFVFLFEIKNCLSLELGFVRAREKMADLTKIV